MEKKTKPLICRVPIDLYDKLCIYAEEQQRVKSKQAVWIIKKYFDKMKNNSNEKDTWNLTDGNSDG